jgi:hypothetical protein
MTKLDRIDIDINGVGTMVKNHYLTVPPYQRSYAWADKQITDLFDDLSNAISQDEEEYFLGSIVVVGLKKDRPEVVDGQQRLATISVLLAAIRDYFIAEGENSQADDIERDFLLSRERRTQERVPRLELNESDHDFYLKRILSRPGEGGRKVDSTKESHRRLTRAFELAEDRVKQIISQAPDPIERLMDWVDYIEGALRVIWVMVPDHANAFVIFETLNDRGLRLSASDLLKNYLFSLSGNRIRETQHKWISMVGALEAVGEEDIVVSYIRHYWSSTHSPARERELYSVIKAAVKSKTAAVNLASSLETEANNYAAMLNTQNELWQSLGATARKHQETLMTLGMEQNRPLLLAVLKHFDKDNVKKALRLMVSWSVRFLIVGGLGGGKMEREYSSKAQAIRDGTISDARNLIKAMAPVVPNDAQFEAAFAAARVSQAHLARYYLRALENTATGDADPELVPNPNEEQVNLEHVLPQTPSGAWGQIDEDTARAVYKRIGNLVLLQNRVNVAVGNKGFAAKADVYKKSSYHLTKNLSKSKTWGVKEIEKRQRELAALAVNTWPIKV